MTHPTPMPAPTPECAAFEPLLPLLNTDTLTPDEATATRQHIAGCAWCRAQCEGYDVFEVALRRHYRSDVSGIRLEGIMRAGRDADADADEAMEDDSSPLVLEISAITPATPTTPGTSRKRLRFAEIAAVVVVGLLVATLLVNRAGVLSRLLFNQTPLKSPAGAVVFTHSVVWGKLQLNGQAISVATDGEKPLYLPRGENTLTYYAPPLPALTCTISAPTARSDTCPLYSGDQTNSANNTQYSGRIVDLRATPDRLSTAQRDALTAAIQHKLDAFTETTQVQPGDHYSTPDGRFLAASQAFPITLSYHLAPEIIGPGIGSCVPYCAMAENHWSIAPSLTWQYVDQFGQQQTTQQGPGRNGESAVDITIQWDGAWQVTLTPSTQSYVLCMLIIDDIEARHDSNVGWGTGCSGALSSVGGGIVVDATFAERDNSAELTAYILYRAGALIALNNNAHRFISTAPGPSAHELAIARQLGFKG